MTLPQTNRFVGSFVFYMAQRLTSRSFQNDVLMWCLREARRIGHRDHETLLVHGLLAINTVAIHTSTAVGILHPRSIARIAHGVDCTYRRSRMRYTTLLRVRNGLSPCARRSSVPPVSMGGRKHRWRACSSWTASSRSPRD